MTEDEIKSKVRVALNEASSEHAQKEALTSLFEFALLTLKRIADATTESKSRQK